MPFPSAPQSSLRPETSQSPSSFTVSASFAAFSSACCCASAADFSFSAYSASISATS